MKANESKRDDFGPQRRPKVLAILRTLERQHGIYLADLNLGNVGFPRDDTNAQ